MLPSLSLITGGAASGKSVFAEGLVRGTGRNLVYVATAQAFDDEMREKLALHKDRRGLEWRTVEEPFDLGRALATIGGDTAVLVDCVTMWLSNHLLAQSDPTKVEAELMAGLERCEAPVVLVTNEVGHCVVPENALARQFRNAQGRLNQRLAAKAGLVVHVISGLPHVLKGELPQ